MTRQFPRIVSSKVIKLEEELYRRDQQIALFKEVVTAVSERSNLDDIFRMAATFAQGMIKAETVLIPVMDPDFATYTYRAGCGLNADEIVGEKLDISQGVCGWVWKHQRPWWHGTLDELDDEERTRWERHAGSIVLVPLVGRNSFLGGIAGLNKIGGRDFDQRDLDLLVLLASQIAIAIDNNGLIDELERANRDLWHEKEKAQVTLSSIGDAVITMDGEGRIEYLNPVAERLFNTRFAIARSRHLRQLGTLLFAESRQDAGRLIEYSLREGVLPLQSNTLVLVQGSRREILLEPNAAPIRDSLGRSSGIVLVLRDVSQAHELSNQLSHQAAHDILTGLFNRREFEYHLKHAIHDAKLNGTEFSLMQMDLDQFKVINDTCGHGAGDELLKRYAARLTRLLRQDDILARIGGDEFGLLLHHSSAPRAADIAGRIQDMTRDFRFQWEDKTFSVGISIGLIDINRQSESVAHVLSRVDAACHMAKESGRGRVYVHDEEDKALHERQGEMEWTPRITKALEEGRMVLYCQPIAARGQPLESARHYEILLRMRDEFGALVPPGAFLPAAERYNLIAAIDRWVISAYFRWLAEHPTQLDALELASVNLSGNSLSDDGCLGHIENELDRYGIPAGKICFEVTETEAIADLSKATRFINRLKEHGCKFALDDFGSGFSSYAYLKNLPVDFLKIDGMFIKDIATDLANYAMVESINHIGHIMGRKTIAEFVEDQDTIEVLNQIGVDYLQGYHIARPRPLGACRT